MLYALESGMGVNTRQPCVTFARGRIVYAKLEDQLKTMAILSDRKKTI